MDLKPAFFLVLITLFILTLGKIGPLGEFLHRLPAGFLNPAPEPYGWSYLVFTVFLINMLTYNASWALVQKFNTLKSEKEIIPVHLGPSWYMEKQAVTIAAGDKVEVTGSRIMYRGKPTIIAAEVKKGDQVLKLRDASGVPAWAGQRRQ